MAAEGFLQDDAIECWRRSFLLETMQERQCLFFRISNQPSDEQNAFKFTRWQFPIRLCFSMTINKSQGQSVKFVGLDLRSPAFTHG